MVVEFGTIIDEEINNQVHALCAWLEARNVDGVMELQPTFRSLMVYYNPKELDFRELKHILEQYDMAQADKVATERKILKVPCCYGARFGLDLGDMEEYTGLDREEIIHIHCSVDYKIYMLGFLPGFVYLGGLDERIHMPRLDSPRKRILPGAVGIGGNQTGVYPMESPGGWRLIGGTPIDFYDPYREPATLCEAGMYIRFEPITIDDYYDIRRQVVEGRYLPEIIMGK